MDIAHMGNWPKLASLLTTIAGRRVDAYECPLCFALTRDPLSHAEYHQWAGTEHPYSDRSGSR